MAVRDNIKDPLGILGEDNHPDPLGILKKKEPSGSGYGTQSSPTRLLSQKESGDILNFIQSTKSPEEKKEKQRQLKTAVEQSHPVTVAPSEEKRLDKEQAEIIGQQQKQQEQTFLKKKMIGEVLESSPDLKSAIFKINNIQNPTGLSEQKRSYIIDKTLNDPDFVEKIQGNPKLEYEYRKEKYDVIQDNPLYGIKKVEQKIGQHIQDSGKNALIYQNPSEEEMDKMVDEMISSGKMTDQEKLLYQSHKDLVKDWIKHESPDVVHSLGRGLESGVKGVESSLRDISNKVTGGVLQSAGLIETNEDRSRRLEQENEQVPLIEPVSKTAKFIKGAGEFTGFAAPMIVGGLLTRGAGLSAEVAEVAPAVLQFEGENAERARELFPNDKKNQLLYTTIGTTIDASLGKLLPSTKAASKISSLIKKDVESAVTKMTGDVTTDEAIKKSLLDKVTSYIGKTAEHSVNAANVVTGFDILHKGLDTAFGKRDFDAEEIGKEAVDTWKNAFVSSLPMSAGMAALPSPKLRGRITAEVAENPEQHIELIRDQAAKTDEPIEVTEKKVMAVKDAAKAWGVIKELPLTDAQKEKFLVKDLEQKELDKQAADTPVDVVKAGIQDKANEAYADKLKIYNGTDKAPEHENFQSAKTPEQIEPELKNQLGEEKATKAVKEVQDVIDYDLFPENLPSYEKEAAKQYPLQFLKEVADQLHTVDTVEGEKTASPKDAAIEKYGKEIADIAEQYFPKNKTEDHALQIESAGGVLQHPQSDIGETGGERGGMEPEQQGQEVAGTRPEEKETGGQEPPVEPQVGSRIHIERPDTQLSFRGLQRVANEFGYEDVKSREEVTDLEEKRNARTTVDSWLEKGTYQKNIDTMLSRIKDKEMVPTAKQRLILEQYLANESEKLRRITDRNSKEFDEQLKKVRNIKEIGQIARQEAGAALRLPEGGTRPNVETIEDAMIAKMEANGVDELTEKQKEDVEKKVKTYEKKDKKAKEKLAESDAKLSEVLAEEAVKKKAKEPRKKKTAEEYKAERKTYLEELRAAKEEHIEYLKKQGIQQAGASPFILTNKMAKAISKIAFSHAEEVAFNLTETVKRVYEEVKDVVSGITEKDIHDVLAGKYNEKRETESELQAKWRDLKEEAKLVNRLEDLLKGNEPKSERSKVERNQKIKDLRDKIEVFKKEEAEANKFRKEDVDKDAQKLIRYKKSLETQTAKIKKRIADKDYEPAEKLSIFENKEFQKKYPKLYKETLDALVERDEAKHQFDIDLLKDEMSRRSWVEKKTDLLRKLVGTSKAIVTGIDDSAVAVQTYMALLTRWKSGGEALAKHVSHLFSQKRFDRYLTELHNSKDWDLMKKSGLNVTEPKSLKESEKEEIFNNRFKGTLPFVKYKGKEIRVIDAMLAPFERMFTTLGNVARASAFRNISKKFIDEGKTFESDPELFKSLATMLNTETGRGKENEYIERSSKFVTMGIWSPKLMAAKFNILGISDLASLGLSQAGTKGYYRQLHPRIRTRAAIDVARFVGTVAALSAAFAYKFGGDWDTDPYSSTFMDVKLPNGKSYNLSGGFSGYIRTIAQAAMGRKDKDGIAHKQDRMETLGRFMRGKMPPVSGALVNAAEGKDFMGKPTSLKEQVGNLLTPISVGQIKDQLKRDGTESFLTQGLPTFVGFNVKDERDYNAKDEDLETLMKRNMLSDEMDRSTIKDYNNGGKIITEKQFDKFADERDKKIKAGLEKMFNEGLLVIDGDKVVKKPYSELTREQVIKETSAIKTKATKETKEELFGKEEKTHQQERLEDKLERAKEKENRKK